MRVAAQSAATHVLGLQMATAISGFYILRKTCIAISKNLAKQGFCYLVDKQKPCLARLLLLSRKVL